MWEVGVSASVDLGILYGLRGEERERQGERKRESESE